MNDIDLRSSFEQLRGRLAIHHAEGHRHFVFFASRAGEGTSTVCLQLASLLANRSHAKVLLVDANLARPVQHKLLAARAHDGLCELLSEKIDSIAAVQEVSEFDLLSCGEPTESPAHLFRSERVKRVMKDLGARYDYVLWDGPPAIENPEAEPLLAAADAAVMVLEAERTRHEVALAAQQVATNAGANVVGVVLNRRRYHIPQSVYRFL